MTTVTDVPRPRTASGVRAALIVAVCGSAMAGLVHAAAARAHEGDRLLVWMIVLCAAAQLGWAAVVAVRPRRVVLVAGVVINGGAVLVWVLTRTVGISFVDSLAEVETVGTQDLAAALLAAAKATYARVFGTDPTLTVVHGGLECAVLGQRLPGVEMISIGPEIVGPHAPGEKVRISSTQRFYRLLGALLGDLSA